jgi:hypothetical protein
MFNEGDEVGVYEESTLRHINRVSRVTATMAIVGDPKYGSRYNRRTGCAVGEGHGLINHATDAMRQKLRGRQLADKLRDINWHGRSLTVLEAVYAALCKAQNRETAIKAARAAERSEG